MCGFCSFSNFNCIHVHCTLKRKCRNRYFSVWLKTLNVKVMCFYSQLFLMSINQMMYNRDFLWLSIFCRIFQIGKIRKNYNLKKYISILCIGIIQTQKFKMQNIIWYLKSFRDQIAKISYHKINVILYIIYQITKGINSLQYSLHFRIYPKLKWERIYWTIRKGQFTLDPWYIGML